MGELHEAENELQGNADVAEELRAVLQADLDSVGVAVQVCEEQLGDLRPYQTQGLEHCHSIRKFIARNLTNRQFFGARPVNVQIMSHVAMKLANKVREGDNADQVHVGARQRELAKASIKKKRAEEVNRVNSVTPGAILKVVNIPSGD